MPAEPLPLRLRILALLRHREGLRRAQAEPVASGGLRPADPDEPADLVFTSSTDHPAVEDFLAVAHATGWIEPFDWVAWRDEAAALVDHPARLAAAGAATLGRLLTAHVRQERFCDGHLGGMVRCGHFEALCARLAALLEEDPACREPAALAWRDAPGPCGRIGSLTPQRQLVLGLRGGGDGTGTPDPAATAGTAVRLRCLACGADHGVPASDAGDARCPACLGGEAGLAR